MHGPLTFFVDGKCDPAAGRAVPAIPDSINPDGTKNAFDSTLFSSNWKLYATFDAIKIRFSPFTVTPVISPELYQINTVTGHATPINRTALTLGAVVDENGVLYAFDNMNSEVLALNPANGDTRFVPTFDPREERPLLLSRSQSRWWGSGLQQ